MTPEAPKIAWEVISPLVALSGGAVFVLLLGLLRSRTVRTTIVPLATVATLLGSAGLGIWQWDANESVIAGALVIDSLAMFLLAIFAVGGTLAVALAYRDPSAEEAGHGEYHALLLVSVLGMLVLVSAQNLVSVFLGLEVLSIPLYVLCATNLTRAGSLESGLKYLVIGSVGSATLLYGFALIYGATGGTDYAEISRALKGTGVADDVLLLTGLALALVGLGFKASVAPFHQWTPDVYQGAPTPVTAFMAVATKAAAFGLIIRFLDVALIDAALDWAPAVAALAAVSIVVGNVGALGQSSLKRILAYSSVAQAGYMLAGVVVSTRLGVGATIFYLAVYLLMNLAAFAVIVARERETGEGDDISILDGLGASRPWLAWPITIAMLALAGFPATSGFWGKFLLIQASVDNAYAWLGVLIVLGSAVSLAYYLRIVSAVWMRAPSAAPVPTARPAIAGGSPELDPPRQAPRRAGPEVVAVGVICAVATIVLGIVPGPLIDVARDAATSLTNLL